MATTVTVAPPNITDTVDQRFFIEAQTGARQPISYLDRFPDTLYTKAIDSVLVTFLYALLGPVGVGLLRKEYLEARLAFEEAGLSTANLDALYTHPWAFARLADETYDIDASASLLSSLERAQVLASDAAFRNRAVDFLKGIRAGGTLKGLSLAAKSGLNHPVEIVENYRFLYDQYCDIRLGLPYLGSTTNTNEIIVLPRQDIPRSAQQTISIAGSPTSGWFTLSLPLGPDYQTIPISVTNGSSIVTVPDPSQTPVGSFFRVSPTSPAYAQVGQILSATTIRVTYPLSAGPTGSNIGTPDAPFNLTFTTGASTGYVGNAETVPLPYNASAGQIQAALIALRVVGNNDIIVTGGPLPDQPVVIRFTGALADQSIPTLQFNLQPDAITGIGGVSASPPLVSQLTDTTNSPLSIVGNVVVDIAGVSSDGQTASISPANMHAMELALDQIRPVTSFVTTQQAQGTTRRVPSGTIFGGTASTEVLRYATGKRSIRWPDVDALHWIEGGLEHEAPRPVGDKQHHYQCFHNVVNAYAYTDAALLDAHYESPTSLQTLADTYYNTKVGIFSPEQVALFPVLAQYQDATKQYKPDESIAASPEPLVITRTLNGVGIINDEYPVDYMGLPGVEPLPTGQMFWSSVERGVGTDFLEIDLGFPQAVNYIYFEATTKPYVFGVSYDTMDMNPKRHFVPATIVNPVEAPSITSLTYDATVSSAWSVVDIHCSNSLDQMIFTRFVRVGFERVPTGSPFVTPTGSPIPYSIEIRNLRIGRNIASASA